MSHATALEILQTYWGYPAFRPPQEEIIQSVLAGQDTLALLPTGGGKSVCFQVPGIALGGLTLVVSPLISLMKDQVQRLNDLGLAATAVTSDLSASQLDQRLQMAMDGDYRFLYLSPERLQSDMFRLRLPKMPVRLLAIDEAHCISQWGHDFRPAYREIARIREVHPQIPVIALTASATHPVREDIVQQLAMRQPQRFAISFARPNLRYFVLPEERVAERISTIIQRSQGSGIVYVRTRKAAETMADYLRKQAISCEAYHGGLPSSERHEVQARWQSGATRVVTATNAFGMGIDKPDVRFVLHLQLPADLESYYQEAGRAGRDGQTALAIAFNNPPDLLALERWNRDKYPSWEQVLHCYQLIANYYGLEREAVSAEPQLLDLAAMARQGEVSPLILHRCLTMLEREGYLVLSEDRDDYAYVQVRLSPDEYRAYQAGHPGTQRLLDHLLRSLGGQVFAREARFLPYQWQNHLGIQPSEYQRQIDTLQQQEVLFYQPPRSQPTVQFLRPRQQLNKQLLNWEKYEFLRQQADERLKQLLAYARRQDYCRSRLIQEYFGEAETSNCGVCDVCIGRYREKVSDDEYQEIQRRLLGLLHRQGPMTYQELLRQGQAGTRAQREKVLRYLLDKALIQVNDEGELSPGQP